ncbi:MAG: hypothetical protein AAB443_02350 [Patescibacteria group bacterium]
MLSLDLIKAKINAKRIKFFIVSLLITGCLFFSVSVNREFRLIYSAIFIISSLALTFWVLEVKLYSKVAFILLILPLHFLFGALVSFFEFPNFSFLMRVLITFIIFNLYYIMLLVLNIFAVVEDRGKSIPLYRVAITWVQILIVVFSIPSYSVMFKLAIHPLMQVLLVTLSTFLLVLFFLVMLDLELNNVDIKLSFLTAFWVFILSTSILFLPFEAFFRGLFLSSVLLFGVGYSYHYLKHSLTRQILLEYIMITIAFLFVGLLFIP